MTDKIKQAKFKAQLIRTLEYSAVGAASVFLFIGMGAQFVGACLKTGSQKLEKWRLEIEPDGKPLRWREPKEVGVSTGEIVGGYDRSPPAFRSKYHDDRGEEATTITVEEPSPVSADNLFHETLPDNLLE